MKLEKLNLLHCELTEEMAVNNITPTVYFFSDGKWNSLDSSGTVNRSTSNNLDRCKAENTPLHPQRSKTVWYYINEIDCGLSLNFPKSPQRRTIDSVQQKISIITKRAINAYKVSHNQLTQLLARDSFREKINFINNNLSKEQNFAEEFQEKDDDKILAILALDIDYFKQINDTYGHIYGDQVLKVFAIRLEQTSKEIKDSTDCEIEIILGHPSGEEFLIAVYGCFSKDHILEWANKFRLNICENPLPLDKEWENINKNGDLSSIYLPKPHERAVTTSIGIAIHNTRSIKKENPDSTTSILDEADTALYRAKTSGRNQVIFFDEILNNCGRILEHDTKSKIIAIDIGKNVGVTLGQEFKVFSPGFTGKRKFSISDGRTVRTIGYYPRIEITTITVFDVQPELSFAYISDEKEKDIILENGSTLEAIPTGSIGHLINGASRYFPYTTSNFNVGDSSAVQNFTRLHAENGGNFSAVFRFTGTQDFLKKFGNAALNSALAKAYQEISSNFETPCAISILDTESICVAGPEYLYNTEDVTYLTGEIRRQLPNLNLITGAFVDRAFEDDNFEDAPETKIKTLNPLHAIEFARYAASDYASNTKDLLIEFDHSIAQRILNSHRDSKKYKQGITDFDKLISLGVENGQIYNLGGLMYSKLRMHASAADCYEKAIAQPDTNIIFTTNLGTAIMETGEFERALKYLNQLTEDDLTFIKDRHYYGYFSYANLMAQAKIANSKFFIEDRFLAIAHEALELREKHNIKFQENITDALSLIDPEK